MAKIVTGADRDRVTVNTNNVWERIVGIENSLDNVETNYTSRLTNVESQLAEKAKKGDWIIDVKDFGAKGDGSTDDTASIQNAINEAYTQNKAVYFPTGNYYVTASLILPNRITLIGSNHYKTAETECIIDSTATNVFVGSTPGTPSSYFQCRLTMKNLYFKGRVNTLFNFFLLSSTTITECLIYNFDTVINGSIANVTEIYNNVFLNIKTSILSARKGTLKSNMTDSKIHHNYISGVAQGTSVLIDLENGNYSEITNNFIDYALTGINIEMSSVLMTVTNNLFDVCFVGVDFKSGNSSIISNNSFGKCSKSDHALFTALSTEDRTKFSTTNWIGVKLGAGTNSLTMQNNVGYKSDSLIDVSVSGNHKINTGGNVNGYSLGVIINYNKGTDINNTNDGQGINIQEMNYQTVTSLPTLPKSFLGQIVWYQGKLCGRKAGNKDVRSLDITAGATVSGNVTIVINGFTINVAVLAGDSASAVASKIQLANYIGYTTSLSGTIITFTAKVAGTVFGSPSFSAGSTGSAGTFSTVTAGTSDYWTDVMGATVS